MDQRNKRKTSDAGDGKDRIPKERKIDLSKNTFDTKVQSDLHEWISKSSKVYSNLKDTVIDLKKCYDYFGHNISYQQDMFGRVLRAASEKQSKVGELLAKLRECETLRSNISGNLGSWDRIQRENTWAQVEQYKKWINNFFEEDLKKTILSLYQRGSREYNALIGKIPRQFSDQREVKEKVNKLNEQVQNIHQTVQDNVHLLYSLESKGVRKEVFKILERLRYCIDGASLLMEEGHPAVRHSGKYLWVPDGETRVVLEADSPSTVVHQGLNTLRGEKVTVGTGDHPFSNQAIRKDSTSSAMEPLQNLAINDEQQKKDISLLQNRNRVKKEKIAQLMKEAREWEPAEGTVRAMLDDKEFKKKYSNSKAKELFEDLQKKLRDADENMLSINSEAVEASWKAIGEAASESKGIRFGLRYLGGKREQQTDHEDLESVEVSTDNSGSHEIDTLAASRNEDVKTSNTSEVREFTYIDPGINNDWEKDILQAKIQTGDKISNTFIKERNTDTFIKEKLSFQMLTAVRDSTASASHNIRPLINKLLIFRGDPQLTTSVITRLNNKLDNEIKNLTNAEALSNLLSSMQAIQKNQRINEFDQLLAKLKDFRGTDNDQITSHSHLDDHIRSLPPDIIQDLITVRSHSMASIKTAHQDSTRNKHSQISLNIEDILLQCKEATTKIKAQIKKRRQEGNIASSDISSPSVALDNLETLKGPNNFGGKALKDAISAVQEHIDNSKS